MIGINSIEARLSNLERVKESKHAFIIVEMEGTKPEHTTNHILDVCKTACEDHELVFNNVLASAFLELESKNPFLEDAPIVITKEVACKALNMLQAAGIEVEL